MVNETNVTSTPTGPPVTSAPTTKEPTAQVPITPAPIADERAIAFTSFVSQVDVDQDFVDKFRDLTEQSAQDNAIVDAARQFMCTTIEAADLICDHFELGAITACILAGESCMLESSGLSRRLLAGDQLSITYEVLSLSASADQEDKLAALVAAVNELDADVPVTITINGQEFELDSTIEAKAVKSAKHGAIQFCKPCTVPDCAIEELSMDLTLRGICQTEKTEDQCNVLDMDFFTEEYAGADKCGTAETGTMNRFTVTFDGEDKPDLDFCRFLTAETTEALKVTKCQMGVVDGGVFETSWGSRANVDWVAPLAVVLGLLFR